MEDNIVNCVFTGCQKTATTRGLCVAHYQTARYLVKSQITSWKALEKAGQAKPRVRHFARDFFLTEAQL
jgi:hypothetical protein